MFKDEEDEASVGLLSPEAFVDEFSLSSEKISQPQRKPSLLLKSYFASFIRFIQRCLLFLVPSFIPKWMQSGTSCRVEPLRPTAFLDGLRGVAAWSVFNTHLASLVIKTSGSAWGLDGSNYEFYKFPIIRTLYSGPFAVCLFYVISGFALSIGPISAMRKTARDPGSAMNKLSSAILRRPFRLFLPAFASTLITFTLIRMNYFGSVIAMRPQTEILVEGWPVLDEWPARMPSFWSQLLHLWDTDLRLLKIFGSFVSGPDEVAIYNTVLWTIRLEWRSSLVLYLTHALLFNMQKRARVLIVSALITLSIYIGGWDFPVFWTGYLIAEFSEFSSQPKTQDSTAGNKSYRISISIASWILAILGLIIGSTVSYRTEESIPYSWLAVMTPFSFRPIVYFWCAVGAALYVIGLRQIPLLLKVYNSGPIQYLGKISFALYLVHFPIVHGAGTLIFYYVWTVIGKSNIVATITGFAIGYTLLLGLVICVADIFWRAVDIPSVEFGKKLEKLLFTQH